MNSAGPNITALTHRLGHCPPIFLREPLHLRQNERVGVIHTGAVLSDLLIGLGHPELSPGEAESFVLRHSESN
ncbi:MAG: hypothetical protein RIF32_10135, partial [Leptospirales bacterium]